MLLRCDQNRVRGRLYTGPFLKIPGWFESPDSQLSNHPGTICFLYRRRAPFFIYRVGVPAE